MLETFPHLFREQIFVSRLWVQKETFEHEFHLREQIPA